MQTHTQHNVSYCRLRSSHLAAPFLRTASCVFVRSPPDTHAFAVHTYIGWARTVYTHHTWPWFPSKKYRMYTIYIRITIWFWPTLHIHHTANTEHTKSLPDCTTFCFTSPPPSCFRGNHTQPQATRNMLLFLFFPIQISAAQVRQETFHRSITPGCPSSSFQKNLHSPTNNHA